MIPESVVESVVRYALAEDVPWGDVTTECLGLNETLACGRVIAREAGVLAGVDVARAVFLAVDGAAVFEADHADGHRFEGGETLAVVRGRASSLLGAERVALNFLQRLSGIATLTSLFVEAVAGFPTRIADTRKTTPCLRALERHAVKMGGGWNHREGLSDGVLIKDNHLAALRLRGIGLAQAVKMARDNARHTQRIEVEVESAEDAVVAAEAGADIILLDNMSLVDMRRAVEVVGTRAITEASGGMSLERVRSVAETGVSVISVGALTHSARALDLALELDLT